MSIIILKSELSRYRRMNGNKNNQVESIFGDKYMMTATMNTEGELEPFPNQFLIVCANAEGFFKL